MLRSLVGSEMCIRDSLHESRSHWALHPSHPRWGDWHWQRLRFPARFPLPLLFLMRDVRLHSGIRKILWRSPHWTIVRRLRPVSYTHLTLPTKRIV
eukprot:TRINITY_DN22775_c0_g1_i1.p1 TRINITY_DN22775_c0_g1~~TRINITY_DN22775_c0_g1_i1.p1  ORF type:complete len:104 (-),score=11.28 TRINITY_DN22775_c0_g1_i1:143-430(-)